MRAPIALQQFDVVGREEANFAFDLSFPPAPFVLHKYYKLLPLRVCAFVSMVVVVEVVVLVVLVVLVLAGVRVWYKG